MERIYFDYEDDIINPCWDNVFKATFTKDTTESRYALNKLLSAIIGRELTVINITANEPPVESINERQIRYDISCKFDDGDLCNVEMTLNPDTYEPIRLEYYSGKLFTSQDIRGKDKTYRDLKNSFQIALLVNSPVYDDEAFVHRFQYYDEENGISLGGRTRIIVLELSKLESISRKPVEEMTSLERWAVFFRYTPDKEKRELVNEILKSEEGIAMAGQVLLTISKDEVERARLLSEYKYAVDLQSKIVEAQREARREAEREKQRAIAKRLLKLGVPIELVVGGTELDESTVLSLREEID